LLFALESFTDALQGICNHLLVFPLHLLSTSLLGNTVLYGHMLFLASLVLGICPD